MATNADDQTSDLKLPLEKTQVVTADIESASLHAFVIGAVLDQALPDAVKVGDVAKAITQTEALTEKLAESAETLADVSAALEDEIEKREKVTRQLGKSQQRVEQLSEQVADLKAS